MIRLAGRALKRQVFGGATVGDLVVELRGDTITLKPKGARQGAAVSVTWNAVYYMACERKAHRVLVDKQEAREIRRAVSR